MNSLEVEVEVEAEAGSIDHRFERKTFLRWLAANLLTPIANTTATESRRGGANTVVVAAKAGAEAEAEADTSLHTETRMTPSSKC